MLLSWICGVYMEKGLWQMCNEEGLVQANGPSTSIEAVE